MTPEQAEWILGRIEDRWEQRRWAEHEAAMIEAAERRPDHFGPRIGSGFEPDDC